MDPKEMGDPHNILKEVSAQTTDEMSYPSFSHLLPSAMPLEVGVPCSCQCPLCSVPSQPLPEQEYQRLNCLDI